MSRINSLVDRLSSEDPRPSSFAPTATVTFAAIMALAVVLAASLTWLEPRADLASGLATHNYIFFLKLIFTVSVVAVAAPIVRDLSVPVRRIRWRSALTILPFVAIMTLALMELARMPISSWSHHVDDASWLGCLLQIPALAVPGFIILAFAVRRLAPTNLTRAGAYVGLLSGAIAAVGYTLHCHDDSVVFVAIFYTLAMLEMTLIGALAGPRILRWS